RVPRRRLEIASAPPDGCAESARLFDDEERAPFLESEPPRSEPPMRPEGIGGHRIKKTRSFYTSPREGTSTPRLEDGRLRPSELQHVHDEGGCDPGPNPVHPTPSGTGWRARRARVGEAGGICP